MGHIISVHSFRGGTGKSNITANLAYLLASRGRRVAVLDTDLQSPGVHFVFGFHKVRITHTLTDFVLGKCEITEAAYNLSSTIDLGDSHGALYLLPCSMKMESITHIIATGYDVEKLNSEFSALSEALDLHLLFVDTHPGFNRETLLTTAISDTLIVLIRPDRQDFHGTALLVELASRLAVPKIYMLANKVVSSLDQEAVRRKISEAFGYEVIGLLPLSEDMARMGSQGLLALQHPSHPLTLGVLAES